MPLPGVRRTPWYVREIWGALASFGSVIPTAIALVKATREDALDFVPWLAAAVALGLVAFSFGIARARWKDTKLNAQESPLDLTACLHVLHANLMSMKGLPQDSDGKCRLTIHRVLDQETLEQAVPYVGGSGGSAGRTFPTRFGIIGRVVLSDEAYYATRKSSSLEEFVSEMAREWGISKDEARKLTPDRCSWMGVPILSQTTNRAIGVVYLDSSDPSFFDDDACHELVLSACEGITRYVARHRS